MAVTGRLASVNTPLDRVGVVVTEPRLKTTPFAVRAEPVMVCPPEDAVVLVMELAATVVVMVGGASTYTQAAPAL